eukprot:TRINITY_DN3772_c0_g1_i1.p1 TRINITY_DN3772_c0_g1~~TRINITY_DN3772_c0_g1_i1.p1  ORF type:complete len:220 (+),score=31.86 TRINITY_DN3772_c0_g1_i1:147-806(+)
MSGRIVYALIARGTVVLAEHAIASGNFITISRVILDKLGPEEAKRSFDYDRCVFHFMVHEGITYLCMTDGNFPRRIAFGFLEDVKNSFAATYSRDAILHSHAFAMNENYSRTLVGRMEYFTNTPPDKIHEIRQQIDDTRDIMHENIDKLLERHEKIEMLVQKTETLSNESFVFKKQSEKLKCALIRKNIIWTVVIVFFALAAIWLLLSGLCGFDFSMCI